VSGARTPPMSGARRVVGEAMRSPRERPTVCSHCEGRRFESDQLHRTGSDLRNASRLRTRSLRLASTCRGDVPWGGAVRAAERPRVMVPLRVVVPPRQSQSDEVGAGAPARSYDADGRAAGGLADALGEDSRDVGCVGAFGTSGSRAVGTPSSSAGLLLTMMRARTRSRRLAGRAWSGRPKSSMLDPHPGGDRGALSSRVRKIRIT